MRRALAALLAATIVALTGAGCNSDDDGGGGTKPPTGIEVKPGRWFVTVTAASGNPTCQTLANFVASADSVTICGEADPDDFLRGLDCSFSVAGNQVTVACGGNLNYLGCPIRYSGQSTGTFNSERTLFSVAVPVRIDITDAQACGGTLDCVITTSLVARWVNDGGCTGSAPGVDAAVAALLAPLGRLGSAGVAP